MGSIIPFWAIKYGDEEEQLIASKMLSVAMATVLAQNGINPDDLLEDYQENRLLLEQGKDCAESELLAQE